MNDEPIIRDFEAFRRLVGLNDLRVERLRIAGEWLRPKIKAIPQTRVQDVPDRRPPPGCLSFSDRSLL